jgi:hypothetical protein
MAVESVIDDPDQKKRGKKLVISILIGVVLLHVVAGIVAGVLVVARYLLPPPATFEVQRDIRLPAKEREHRMNMDAFDAMTPKPSFNDKMKSLQPAKFALPDLPKIPMDQMLPLDPSSIVSDQVSSIVGTAGIGGGGEGAGGLGGEGSGVSFLGIETTAKRILLLYDISTTVTKSVKEAGMTMEDIREETKKVLDGLGINTRFGMAQFARNYAFFQNELIPATDDNRAAARAWLDQWFATTGSMPRGTPNIRTGSPGFVELVKEAFTMQPDVIFVISDGRFFAGSSGGSGGFGGKIDYDDIGKALKELQDGSTEPVQINFIGVGMDRADKQGVQQLRGRYFGGGKFRELR